MRIRNRSHLHGTDVRRIVRAIEAMHASQKRSALRVMTIETHPNRTTLSGVKRGDEQGIFVGKAITGQAFATFLYDVLYWQRTGATTLRWRTRVLREMAQLPKSTWRLSTNAHR